MLERIRNWARTVKRDVIALYIAGRDPRTPWIAKVLAVAIVAYALSPIDLIPDFIPILGYLDDLLLVPLGLLLVVALIPKDLMAEYRHEAEHFKRPPVQWSAAIVIGALWLIGIGLLVWWAAGYFQ